MAKQTKKILKKDIKTVTVSSHLRQEKPWFEEEAQIEIEFQTILKRIQQVENFADKIGGKELSPYKRKIKSDQLERLTRKLIPLLKREKQLKEELRIDFGFTGITEIVGELGTTLISASASIALSETYLRKNIRAKKLKPANKRILNEIKMLLLAEEDEQVRAEVINAILVQRLELKVIPPSSRGADAQPK